MRKWTEMGFKSSVMEEKMAKKDITKEKTSGTVKPAKQRLVALNVLDDNEK